MRNVKFNLLQESVEHEPEPEEVSETPTSDLEESEKRGHEDDAEASDATEPATKKFKPEEQPEAIATAVVWNHATSSIDKKNLTEESIEKNLSRTSELFQFSVFSQLPEKKFIVERNYFTMSVRKGIHTF